MRKISIIAFAIFLMGLAVPAYAQSQGDPSPDCADFKSQAGAQASLRAHPDDPGGLDGAVGPATSESVNLPDSRPHPGDGIACESLPDPRDEQRVLVKNEPPVDIVVNEDNCEAFSAQVTDLAPGDKVRFQFGHDIVRFVTVTEQDTAASFTLSKGEAPEGDWGFSVRVNDQEISDQIVTVKACSTEGGAVEGPLPFTGSHTPLLLVVGLSLLLVGFGTLFRSRTVS